MKDLYTKHLQSNAWKITRQARIDFDSRQCVVCHSNGPLEVHHITYERLGHELINDLMTVCQMCHTMFTDDMRLSRYEKRKFLKSKSVEPIKPIKNEIKTNGVLPTNNAQRSDIRPVKFLRQRTQESIWQKRQDRS